MITRKKKSKAYRSLKESPAVIDKSVSGKTKVLLLGITLFIIGLWAVLGIHWNVYTSLERDVGAVHQQR
jgi:hypothetical protein